MIEQNNEERISLTAAARLPILRVNGSNPNSSALSKWGSKGVRGVRLETIRVGGATCTSLPAIERFLRRLNRQLEPAGAAAS